MNGCQNFEKLQNSKNCENIKLLPNVMKNEIFSSENIQRRKATKSNPMWETCIFFFFILEMNGYKILYSDDISLIGVKVCFSNFKRGFQR